MPVPRHTELFNPVLRTIKKLGGSASIAEINEEVIKSLSLSEAEINHPHDARQTEVEYQLAWARSLLKIFGVLDNSERGVWVITPKGKEVDEVDPREVKRFVSQRSRNQRSNRQRTQTADEPEYEPTIDNPEVAEVIREQVWKKELLTILRSLNPDTFERLCQRLLRESGFVEVQVTGRSGDGGIDGVGRVRIGGLLGFPILFQCKRWQGSVGPNVIRDFRGAMIGRTDRGIIITTGTFSRDAKQEATRDGAPPIDLIDGEQLIEKLKELQLGVHIKMIEQVIVDPAWFKEI